MNVKHLSLVCASVLLGLPLAGMSRTTGESATATNVATVSVQVKTLAAMSGPERRAAMQKMSPEERRGVWFEAKRFQAEQRRAQLGSTQKTTRSQKVPADIKLSDKWKRAKTVGTIQYDSGMPNTTFGNGSPFLPGNKFDTHTGLPLQVGSGTVSTVQAVVLPGPAAVTMTTSMGAVASAGFVLTGPQTTMGGAMAVFSTFGPATGTVDTVTFASMGATYLGSSFFVLFGDFASSYLPAFGPGTTQGQGHHAVVGNTGMMGPNMTNITSGTAVSGLNGFIRANGNILPVELMQFSVE